MKNEISFAFAILLFICLFLMIGYLLSSVLDVTHISPNEQTLNAYATFESTCAYRGYDRDECLQIWSGR